MIKVKMSFEIDNDHIKRTLSALDLKCDDAKHKICGKYRGKKVVIDEDEAGEKIGQYFSEYCEFHGTGIENAVEDLEANDDSRDGLMEMICEKEEA